MGVQGAGLCGHSLGRLAVNEDIDVAGNLEPELQSLPFFVIIWLKTHARLADVYSGFRLRTRCTRLGWFDLYQHEGLLT